MYFAQTDLVTACKLPFIEGGQGCDKVVIWSTNRRMERCGNEVGEALKSLFTLQRKFLELSVKSFPFIFFPENRDVTWEWSWWGPEVGEALKLVRPWSWWGSEASFHTTEKTPWIKSKYVSVYFFPENRDVTWEWSWWSTEVGEALEMVRRLSWWDPEAFFDTTEKTPWIKRKEVSVYFFPENRDVTREWSWWVPEVGEALNPLSTLQRKHLELRVNMFPFIFPRRIVMSHLEILEYLEELLFFMAPMQNFEPRPLPSSCPILLWLNNNFSNNNKF